MCIRDRCRADLGQVGERGGQCPAGGGQVGAGETRGAVEAAVQVRGRVGHPGQRPLGGRVQLAGRADDHGQRGAGHPEGHRRLQRPGGGVTSRGEQGRIDRTQIGVSGGKLRAHRVRAGPGDRLCGARHRDHLVHQHPDLGGGQHREPGQAGHALQERDALLRLEGARTRPAHVDGPARVVEDLTGSDQDRPGVRERDDLAGRTDAPRRDRRHHVGVQQGGQLKAELRRDARRGVQQGPQPDGQQRPGPIAPQPGRRPDGPAGHQRVLVPRAGLGVQSYPGERAHAGVDAVDRLVAVEGRQHRGAARGHLRQQGGIQDDPLRFASDQGYLGTTEVRGRPDPQLAGHR